MRYAYVLEIACPIVFDDMLFLRSRTIGSQVLDKIRHRIAGDGDGAGAPRRAGCRLRIYARRVIDKIGRKARLALLFLGEISRELMHDRSDHFKMPELLCADCGSSRATSAKNPCAARVTGQKRE